MRLINKMSYTSPLNKWDLCLCNSSLLFCFPFIFSMVVTRLDWSMSILHLDHLWPPLATFNILDRYLPSSSTPEQRITTYLLLTIVLNDNELDLSKYLKPVPMYIFEPMSHKITEKGNAKENSDKAIILSHQLEAKSLQCKWFCV